MVQDDKEKVRELLRVLAPAGVEEHNDPIRAKDAGEVKAKAMARAKVAQGTGKRHL